MQSVFSDNCHTIASICNVKCYIYLDDLLFIGSKANLIKVVKIFMKSDANVDFKKSVLKPISLLTYPGIRINIKEKQIRLIDKVFNKVMRVVNFTANQAELARKFWSRFGGLINFITSALDLPSFLTQLALSGFLAKALPRGWLAF